MCFSRIITERYELVFITVAKVYDAFSVMDIRVWGATVGLMVGFLIGGAVL